MAISVTEILGTDSLSGSRLVINDNFNILTSEINAMEVYFAPSAGTITNLNNVSTEALRVGLSTILLDINASTFDILTNVKMTGNLNMTGGGIFRNDTSPTTLDDTGQSMPVTIQVGTTTAIPPYTMYRVGNADPTVGAAGTLTLQLNTGSIGQEIFFVYSVASSNVVSIIGNASNLVLSAGGTSITLDAIGQTIHLLAIDNGSGAAVWYVVGGNGYTIV
jgi:hypothetical protein